MTRGTGKSEMDAKALMQATEVIIQAYGRAIETSPLTPGCVADVQTLPYSKDKIKSALMLALKFTDDRWMRRQLKAGYLHLADYQENVGPNYQVIAASDVNANNGLGPVPTNRVTRTSSATDWASIVQREKQKLRHELKELGL